MVVRCVSNGLLHCFDALETIGLLRVTGTLSLYGLLHLAGTLY